MDKQNFNQDIPEVPEWVTIAIQNIWITALKEADKAFDKKVENLHNAITRLRNENARLYKESQRLQEELKKEKERTKELEKKLKKTID